MDYHWRTTLERPGSLLEPIVRPIIISPALLMILRLFSFAVFLLSWPLDAAADSPVRLGALTCEHLSNPVGIGVRRPRLSWKLYSGRAGEIQTAWQVRAASTAAALAADRTDLWNSGKVASDQSILIPWAGNPLGSRTRVFWQVRIWDKNGDATAWSEPAFFELGLLDPATEWKGRWITADLPRHDVEQEALARASWISAGSGAGQAAAVRFTLDLPAGAKVRRAAADIAGDGLITLYVNGDPTRQGPSSRTAPLRADLRTSLKPGRNIVAIASAAVRGGLRHSADAVDRNAIAAHGLIELEDGQRFAFDTDSSWKAAVAPAGEWFATGYDDTAWPAATMLGPYAAQPSSYADTTIGPGRYLRKNFAARSRIAKARLYATALGVYAAFLNGRPVSDTVLDPGWTDYTKRVMVQTWDVTRLLRVGPNVIGAVLGDGWYAGRLGWMGLAQYGARPAFNAQLEITYADGSTEIIATDDSWRAGPGEIVGSDEQWGEVIDARRAFPRWTQPTFDDTAWAHAVAERHDVALVPQLGPAVRKLLELSPKMITHHGADWIVDFGQNLVGHVRIGVRGPAGTTVTLRHAEMLNADSSLYTANLRAALATDTFTLAGESRGETFEPLFTFHGFRYVEVAGYPGELTPDDLRAIVVGSDLQPTGTFECSDAGLNRLYENIVWSQRGNFLSVPTDCPQRDERMGWMGDAQVFAPTAACCADVAAFFAKWMVDVDDGQSPRGDYADVSPRVDRPQPAWPVWGDAGVIVPWAMYTAYGDKAFLADNFAPMARWVEFSRRNANSLVCTGGVGDHLAPRRTPVDVVDTAYFAHSAQLLARAAAILGRADDASKYDRLFHDITAAFNRNFVSPEGTIKGDTQTAYLLALQFDLLPQELRARVARRLAADVEQNGHLTTGFVGVGLICPVLTQIGRSDLAWQLVLTDTYPSWLFSVRNGATSIWERWDGWTPEHGFQDPAMNSFNHYSLGSVGAWLYADAAGIQPDEDHPGYKRFWLRPQFTPRLAYVKATLDSPYGVISSHWRAEGDQLLYDVTIPPNTSAVLTLPVPPQDVRQSGKRLPAGGAAATSLTLSAGTYHFAFARRLLE